MTRIAVARLSNHLAGVPAFILAGGLGTRLREAVSHVPKALAPIHGRPFLAYLLDQLSTTAVRRVVLLTGHHAEAIESVLGARHGALRLEYSREPTPLGTGGAVRQALGRVDAQTILLLNGDSYCRVDLAAAYAFHRRNRADLTMVAVHQNDARRFGQIRLAGDRRIMGFQEKAADIEAGWINAGIYFAQRNLLEELPTDQPCSLERDWLPRWVAARNVMGFNNPGPFIDIGTPESYADALRFFAATGGPRGSHALSA